MNAAKPLKFVALAVAGALVAALAAPAAFAADTAVRVRGTVVAIAGDTLKVKSREGADLTIAMTTGWRVAAVSAMTVADIKPGDYVGIASLPKASGGDDALEVLVFPPAMKGMGEGNRDWDLKPDSSMTNGSVDEAVQSVDGRTVNVTYHGQSKKITVPNGTPVVTLAPATLADIKAGVPVFVSAQKAADGKLSAGQMIVGKNGVVPPM